MVSKMNPPTGLVFFGSPDASAFLLDKLASQFPVLLVVTRPDKPVGRRQILTPTPVAQTAQNLGLPVIKPKNLTEELMPKLSQLKPKPTFGFLFSYGRIIPNSIINFFPKGIINLHPSLLPQYRGASPVRQAIMDRRPFTGWSLMVLDDKLDHGPIIYQQRIPIDPDDDQQSLLEKIIKASSPHLGLIIQRYLAGQLTPQPQDDNKASFTQIITKDKAEINWDQNPLEIKAFVQAMHPWPVAFTWVTVKNKKLRLKIYQVKAGSGWLEPIKVQLEGKRVVDWQTFIRAYSKDVLPAKMRRWLR